MPLGADDDIMGSLLPMLLEQGGASQYEEGDASDAALFGAVNQSPFYRGAPSNSGAGQISEAILPLLAGIIEGRQAEKTAKANAFTKRLEMLGTGLKVAEMSAKLNDLKAGREQTTKILEALQKGGKLPDNTEIGVDESGRVSLKVKQPKQPTSIEGILAQRVQSGEMSLDAAIKQRAAMATPPAIMREFGMIPGDTSSAASDAAPSEADLRNRALRRNILGAPSEAIQKGLLDGQLALQQLTGIKGLFSKSFVGPIEGRLGAARTQFPTVAGMLTPYEEIQKESTFRNAVESYNKQYIKALRGAQVGPAEVKEVEKEVLPKVNMSEARFQAAIENSEQLLRQKLGIAVGMLDQMGIPAPIDRALFSGGTSGAAEGSSSGGGLGEIPSDVLLDAIRQGNK